MRQETLQGMLPRGYGLGTVGVRWVSKSSERCDVSDLKSNGSVQHEQSRGRRGLRGVCKINPVSPLWLCTGDCDQIEEPE